MPRTVRIGSIMAIITRRRLVIPITRWAVDAHWRASVPVPVSAAPAAIRRLRHRGGRQCGREPDENDCQKLDGEGIYLRLVSQNANPETLTLGLCEHALAMPHLSETAGRSRGCSFSTRARTCLTTSCRRSIGLRWPCRWRCVHVCSIMASWNLRGRCRAACCSADPTRNGCYGACSTAAYPARWSRSPKKWALQFRLPIGCAERCATGGGLARIARPWRRSVAPALGARADCAGRSRDGRAVNLVPRQSSVRIRVHRLPQRRIAGSPVAVAYPS